MKNIFWTTGLLLVIACSSSRKSVNRSSQVEKSSALTQRDSISIQAIDITGLKTDHRVSNIESDSNYERSQTRLQRAITISEPVSIHLGGPIKDSVGRSNYFILPAGSVIRETKTIIQERGRKIARSTATLQKSDSSHISKSDQAQVKSNSTKNSTSEVEQVTKAVRRNGLPWYLWFIAVVCVLGIVWWKGPGILRKVFNTKS